MIDNAWPQEAPHGFVRTRLTESEVQGAEAVAGTIGRSHRIVRWHDDVPGIGWGLAVHAPWSRVLVACTGLQAQRWPAQYKQGVGVGRALLDSLLEHYPAAVTPWGSLDELRQRPLPNPDLRRFLTWSLRNLRRDAWPLLPGLWVVGSWASWPDAVLLARQEAEETVFQLLRDGRAIHGSVEPVCYTS